MEVHGQFLESRADAAELLEPADALLGDATLEMLSNGKLIRSAAMQRICWRLRETRSRSWEGWIMSKMGTGPVSDSALDGLIRQGRRNNLNWEIQCVAIESLCWPQRRRWSV